MLKWLIKLIRFFKDPDVKLTKKLIFLIPIVYFLLPYDFFVDFFPGLGQIDDIGVFLLTLPFIKNILDAYESDKNGYDKNKSYKNTIDIDEDDYNVE